MEKINRITSCEECKNGYPLWYFTASSAVNDVKSKYYLPGRDPESEWGICWIYSYLRLPNVNVDRARGFLVPELLINSNLGVGVKLPYFIPIGDSRDLLVTPYLSPKTKTIEYRYRQKLSNGDITINGALSVDDLSNKDIGSYFEVYGSFKLAYGTNLKINAAGKMIKNIWVIIHGTVDNLGTVITLSKVIVNKTRLFSGNVNFLKDNKDYSSVEEYYA